MTIYFNQEPGPAPRKFEDAFLRVKDTRLHVSHLYWDMIGNAGVSVVLEPGDQKLWDQCHEELWRVVGRKSGGPPLEYYRTTPHMSLARSSRSGANWRYVGKMIADVKGIMQWTPAGDGFPKGTETGVTPGPTGGKCLYRLPLEWTTRGTKAVHMTADNRYT